jgi:hypothetical protein
MSTNSTCIFKEPETDFWGKEKSYYVKSYSDATNDLSETDIFKILDFMIDNIFFYLVVVFFFQQTVNIPKRVLIVLPF